MDIFHALFVPHKQRAFDVTEMDPSLHISAFVFNHQNVFKFFMLDACCFMSHDVKTRLFCCISGMDGGHQEVLWQASEYKPRRARC